MHVIGLTSFRAFSFQFLSMTPAVDKVDRHGLSNTAYHKHRDAVLTIEGNYLAVTIR